MQSYGYSITPIQNIRTTYIAVDSFRRDNPGLSREIPYFDPLDGGINAKCLFLFEAPGPRAVYSNFISRNNPDESAKNFFELNQQAGLLRELTISWNIVPWYIGSGTKIRPANSNDIDEGKKYLVSLISLLQNLQIIVLGGKKAQKAEALITTTYPKLTIVKMPHLSPLFVNNAPENKFKILRILEAVQALLSGIKNE
jgi:hypothetical protein